MTRDTKKDTYKRTLDWLLPLLLLVMIIEGTFRNAAWLLSIAYVVYKAIVVHQRLKRTGTYDLLITMIKTAKRGGKR